MPLPTPAAGAWGPTVSRRPQREPSPSSRRFRSVSPTPCDLLNEEGRPRDAAKSVSDYIEACRIERPVQPSARSIERHRAKDSRGSRQLLEVQMKAARAGLVFCAPGQPSVWPRAETSAANPAYSASVNYPDLAIMYLDRDLPFDPIPLLRAPVTSADKKGEIAGWGGSKALVADISQVEGAGIKRSAKVKLLGSPTEADYHPDDPNPGLLDPTIRPNLLKTDGMAPSANSCAGDSGGPLLVESRGRTYLAGVGFWTGLYCEDYAIFTRIDPFIAFFDDAIARAGKAPIVPRLECVEPQAGGSFLAHFGYKNDNALTVTIPYGKQNLFAKDTAQARPSQFEPGDNAFDFAVPFASKTQLSWKLTPPCGTSTTVLASATSPVCDPANPTFVCAKTCDVQFAAECADQNASRPQCITDCVSNTAFFADYAGCGTAWSAYLGCTAGLPPAAANWDCSFPGFPPQPLSPNCDPELNALYGCLGYY